MTITRSICAAALLAAPGLALAQGFEGAELSAHVAALSNDSKLGVASYAGGIQIGLFAGISAGVDIAAHDWRGISGRSNTYTLHGIYELFPGTSVGAYLGQERSGDTRATTYGIEGATELAGIDLAGHLGRWEADAASGTTLGIEGSFALGQAFALTGGLGAVSGDEDVTTVSLGGEYRFGGGPVVFAGIAHETADDESDTYLSLGARVELGNGTTFGSRGLSANRPLF